MRTCHSTRMQYIALFISFFVCQKKKKKFHVWWNSWRVNEEALAGFTLLFRRIQTLTSSPMLVFLLVSIIVLTCFAILLQHFTHFATWLFHFYYFLFVVFCFFFQCLVFHSLAILQKFFLFSLCPPVLAAGVCGNASKRK